jgi:cystathionine gamma-synthase
VSAAEPKGEGGFRLDTRVVHAGLDPDHSYGAVIPPIHQTSTFRQRAPGELAEGYDYARSGNPTRDALERALGELEGGFGSAFASGMAATHAVITAICTAGDHLILPVDLYGGTYRLVDKVLTGFGLSYDLVDQGDPENVRAALRENTSLVWVESPTNPLLNVVDLAAVIEAAGSAAVVVDNTFATPVVQRPLELGATAVVHSTTKYLGGHSDVIGGAVIARDAELHERVRFVQTSVGAVPGPLDCFLVHRGLRTLALRVARHSENGRAVSEFLSSAPDVEDVRWPGFGGMVSFRHPDAAGIVARTELFTLAESLGGVESLIEVPQAMTHQSVEDSAAAVPPDLVRLSCGIEAPEDLIADLDRALAGRRERLLPPRRA